MAQPVADEESQICFRDLLAGGRQVSAAVLDELDLANRAGGERPYVVVNMISTLDGRATLDGRTAKISSEADRALFHRLRAQGDAVMIGAGTVRTERYGRLIRDPELRELRARRGLGEPLAVIVSASLRLDPTIPLLADPSAHIVVLTPSPEELEGAAARVEYLRGSDHHGEVTLAPLLARLRHDHGVRSIVCEGGPTLNDALLLEDLVDELFLSVAPKLVGGAAPLTIVSGAEIEAPRQFELVGLLESDSHLFCRYRSEQVA